MYPHWKRRDKIVSLWRWHDSIYNNQKYSAENLLKLTSEFSQLSGYKINIQEQFACLYNSNDLLEKEYKVIQPLKIAPPQTESLGIMLPGGETFLDWEL